MDLRVKEQILAMAGMWPTGVFALSGSGAAIDDRLRVWRSGSDPAPSRAVPASVLATELAEGASPYSSRFSSLTATELRTTIDAFEPDVVILSGLEVTPYLDTARGAGVRRIILDLHESTTRTIPSIAAIEQNRGRALFRRHVGAAMQSVEALVVTQVEQVWLASEVERHHFRASYPLANDSCLVPNTVDVDGTRWVPVSDPHRVASSIVYPASFGYEPNLDAARFLVDEVMPLLPEMTLALVGSSIPAWMRNLDHPRIAVLGPVPDMTPHLARSGSMPVPLRAGGGTRLKVLEALAVGTPVISTSLGVEGLGLGQGVHFLLAETAEEFAAGIERVRDDTQLAHQMSVAGRGLVETGFSRTALMRALTAALAGAT
jgi:glycosyltransferase involved in cell wall biosynthesis